MSCADKLVITLTRSILYSNRSTFCNYLVHARVSHARIPNGAPPAGSLIMPCLHALSLLHGILYYNLFDARYPS